METRTISDLLKRKEVQAVLLILKEIKEPLTNIDLVNSAISMNLLKGKKNSLKVRVSRSLGFLCDMKLVKYNKLGKKTKSYYLSDKFRQNLSPAICQFSDSHILSTYPADLIFSRPNITFYGISEEMYNLEKNSGIFRELNEIIKTIKEQIQKLESVKKAYRLPIITKNFEKFLNKRKSSKIKKFLNIYKPVLIHILNATDWDEELLLERINKGGFDSGFRGLNFINTKYIKISKLPKERAKELKKKEKEDLERLRKILPRNEQKWSDKQIKKKYGECKISLCYGMELWEHHSFHNDLNKLTTKEREDLAKFLGLIIKKTLSLYPTKITLVGNSFRGRIAPDELITI